MVLILTSKWLVGDIYSLLVAYNQKLLLLIEKDEKNLSSLSFSNLFIPDILRTLNSYQLYLLTRDFSPSSWVYSSSFVTSSSFRMNLTIFISNSWSQGTSCYYVPLLHQKVWLKHTQRFQRQEENKIKKIS